MISAHARVSSEGGGGMLLAPCVRRLTKGLHSACRDSFTRPYVPLVVDKLIHLRHGDPQPEALAAASTSFEATRDVGTQSEPVLQSECGGFGRNKVVIKL